MSILGREISAKGVGALTALMVLTALTALLPALSATPPREITLTARNMAFYAENDPRTPNPDITARAGERLRIVLRNEDSGMTHDFAVPAVGVAMNGVRRLDYGEVIVEVPSVPGSYQYVCRPHQLMMHGTIKVLPD